MRDIKFRAWTGSQMEYSVMAGFLGAFYVRGIDESDTASMSPFNTIYSDQTPVMQYTGLEDKGGVDIYESDILAGGDTVPGEVVFCDGSYRLHQGENNTTDSVLVQWRTERLQVIGNRHQNPELLEKNNG